MSDIEKSRRKAIWDKMPESERKRAEQEKSDIMRWAAEEERKAIENIKAAGRYQGGLDGNYPELINISKKTKQKLNALLDRIFGTETTSQK